MRHGWWRVVLATAAFSLVVPIGFVALPLAALLVATRPAGTASVLALALAALGAWTLLPASGDRLGTLEAAFALSAAVAFAGGAVLAPAGRWRQAVRAVLWAAAATLGLAWAAWGGIAWGELHWELTRAATVAAFTAISLVPRLFSVLEPLVRLFSDAAPGLLVLQTLAGLALAWSWHTRLEFAPAPASSRSEGQSPSPIVPSHT